MFSLVIPVYRNRETLEDVLQVLKGFHARLPEPLEAVFVVDGSPDDSENFLAQSLPQCSFPSLLVSHSRNFGSFNAIRTGLAAGTGPYFATLSADLQEPSELVESMCQSLRNGDDVVIAVRQSRSDGALAGLFSALFWWIYRRGVQPEMPPGGVDMFACSLKVRDALLGLKESQSTLVGLLLWLGYRRSTISYARLPRRNGHSAWTFFRRWRYMTDSLFAFSDVPITLMILLGLGGLLMAGFLGTIVLVARWEGRIPVPGYAGTVLTLLFFGGLNSLGLGIVGSYVWRVFENTKGRPFACVSGTRSFSGRTPPS